MRWPACLFLAYVFVGLQIGGAEYLRIGSARPDLVLLAVIFIAIHAPREAALLGAFSIGIIQDLVSLNPLGVYALAYSMVGMFVVSTQELVYKAHPVTHFTLGLTGGLLCAVVVAIHGWVRGPRASVTELLAAALYTALLAPLVLGLLNLTRGAFAFSAADALAHFDTEVSMFERRLKISLGILLAFMGILLVRAFELQVVTRGDWVKAADEFKRKPVYVETTRGRILDVKGRELAVDEACMDACVDYRAITRDPVWIQTIAQKRAEGIDGWLKADKKQRQAMIDQQIVGVKRNIDDMFVLIAKETGRDPEQIEDACHQIDLRVAMGRRIRQFKRFQKAEAESTSKGAPPWYRRWLIEGGSDGPAIDDFDQPEGEEVGVHPLVRNITPDAYLHLARALPQCPGLQLRPGTHRFYEYHKAACHLLGSVSTVTAEDLNAQPDENIVDALTAYRFNDTIGRGGLESLCEPTLRGKRGKSYKSAGDEEDEVESVPVPGGDVRTTIDIELQDQIQKMFEHMPVGSNRLAEKNLPPKQIGMHGAAVVIDVKTGDVRALASYPDFDVNTLSDKIETMISDPLLDAPLLNRATQSQLEPGSTIKPVVGISAITQGLKVPDVGVMTIKTGIHCTGFLILNGHKLPNGRCWTASKYYATLGEKAMEHRIPPDAPHRGVYGNPDGYLCFADALERSCNVYFETVANAFDIEGLSYWYDRFGLGRETGVGISEACGFLPRELKLQQQSVAWFSGIGQVGVRATPIQMANVAATIARQGIWMRPRLVDGGYSLNPVKPRGGGTIPDRADLQLNKEALAAAKDGMVRVVYSRGGTGNGGGRLSDITVAGKTGTAQAAEIRDPELDGDGHPKRDEKGRIITHPRDPAFAGHETKTPWYRGWGEDGKSLNHSWFIGFAPADDPQVAFAVMVQYGGSGGGLAGETANKVLTACIEHGYIKPTGVRPPEPGND